MSYGGFKPSRAASDIIEMEAKLTQKMYADPHEPNSDDNRQEYRTEAEESCAPFLARIKAMNDARRNYVIDPGGKMRFKTEPEPQTLRLPNERRESFGHYQSPDDKRKQP